MFKNLDQIKDKIYDKYKFDFANFIVDTESLVYEACQFKLNNRQIISRAAKITPKKVGQFVTFWKRNKNGPIAPFHESDKIDFYAVSVCKGDQFGQFVFPKVVLLKKGIISTEKKEGKRAFRVYPSWDTCSSKQAQKTQMWQLEYFYKIDNNTQLDKVKSLYNIP